MIIYEFSVAYNKAYGVHFFFFTTSRHFLALHVVTTLSLHFSPCSQRFARFLLMLGIY